MVHYAAKDDIIPMCLFFFPSLKKTLLILSYLGPICNNLSQLVC